MNKIKLLLNFPFAWIPLFFYWTAKERAKINEDIEAFYRVLKVSKPTNYTKAFYILFATTKEFRSVFYMRIGYKSLLLSWLWRPMLLLRFAVKSKNIGGDFCPTRLVYYCRCRTCGQKFVDKSECYYWVAR